VFERRTKFSGMKLRAAGAAGLIAHDDLLVWLRPRAEGVIEEVAEFLRMEVSDMIDLDAMLPKQKRTKRAASDPVYRNLHVLMPAEIKESVTTDITEGGKYIVRSENKLHRRYKKYEYGLNHFEITDTGEWRTRLHEFPKLTLPRIVLVTEHQETQLKKYGDWQRYTMAELLVAMETHIDFSNVLDAKASTTFGYHVEGAMEAIYKHAALFPDDIADLANKYHVMKTAWASPDQRNTLRYNIYRGLGGKQKAKTVSTLNSETTAAYEAVTAKYPVYSSMMECLRNYRYVGVQDVEGLATYFKLFDAQHKG
jgi:hypothetical protein